MSCTVPKSRQQFGQWKPRLGLQGLWSGSMLTLVRTAGDQGLGPWGPGSRLLGAISECWDLRSVSQAPGTVLQW